ncbi:phage holin family protein [Paenibacillus dendritiformis]|uniref:phage holin family protein n=1 Tax=Paenibacillus dendritiformis TaxID=130049 RepID=UPI001F54AF6F|nr:phage holin family protein [Paenibacillus dendritiformis]
MGEVEKEFSRRSDQYDAFAKMTQEQVATRYPCVDSMTNVKNPYAIVTGGNLLPPFYFMGPARGAEMVIKSDYEMDLITRSPDQFAGIGSMEAKHKTNRIEFDSAGTDVRCYFNELAAPSTDPIRQHEIDISGATVTIGDDAKYIGVYFGNKLFAGTFKVRNPILTIGSERSPLLRDATIFFNLANELLSIIENGGCMGAGLPQALIKAVEVLKAKGGEEKDDNRN